MAEWFLNIFLGEDSESVEQSDGENGESQKPVLLGETVNFPAKMGNNIGQLIIFLIWYNVDERISLKLIYNVSGNFNLDFYNIRSNCLLDCE